mmetsp:Transcript_4875/g.12497  ORF Transcript_4875/g.12497 Transcript_4875/m.12497 type:complete len:136 (+) Transcript_4875:339-746(+)
MPMVAICFVRDAGARWRRTTTTRHRRRETASASGSDQARTHLALCHGERQLEQSRTAGSSVRGAALAIALALTFLRSKLLRPLARVVSKDATRTKPCNKFAWCCLTGHDVKLCGLLVTQRTSARAIVFVFGSQRQ